MLLSRYGCLFSTTLLRGGLSAGAETGRACRILFTTLPNALSTLVS